MADLSPVLIITGPTASGKSALAVDVAQQFNGVVINADSMQVYAELNILSARPSAEEMAQVPHRLYGEMCAAEGCSAGRWLEKARIEIEAAWQQGLLPIVTGGTGLYLKALTQGLAPVPNIPENVRQFVRDLFENVGFEGLRLKLAFLDPQSAETLAANDPQRLMRAYEVVMATGVPLAQWVERQQPEPDFKACFAAIVLVPDRENLYPAINARFDGMMAAGALDEAAAFGALGLDKALPAMKAVGIPELLAHLEGALSLEEAVEKAKRVSRNYAKRQLTWLRHQDLGCPTKTIPAQYSESISEEIFSFVRKEALTTQS